MSMLKVARAPRAARVEERGASTARPERAPSAERVVMKARGRWSYDKVYLLRKGQRNAIWIRLA